MYNNVTPNVQFLQAPWLALDEDGLTIEETERRLKEKAAIFNAMADAIKDNTNLYTLGSINIAAGIIASVLNEASVNEVSVRSIDIPFREKVTSIFEVILLIKFVMVSLCLLVHLSVFFFLIQPVVLHIFTHSRILY